MADEKPTLYALIERDRTTVPGRTVLRLRGWMEMEPPEPGIIANRDIVEAEIVDG